MIKAVVLIVFSSFGKVFVSPNDFTSHFPVSAYMKRNPFSATNLFNFIFYHSLVPHVVIVS